MKQLVNWVCVCVCVRMCVCAHCVCVCALCVRANVCIIHTWLCVHTYLFSLTLPLLTCPPQALTAGDSLNSKPSEPLVMTWPGTRAPQIRRIPSISSSSLRVTWTAPFLTDGVKVKHFKVSAMVKHFKDKTTAKLCRVIAKVKHLKSNAKVKLFRVSAKVENLQVGVKVSAH